MTGSNFPEFKTSHQEVVDHLCIVVGGVDDPNTLKSVAA